MSGRDSSKFECSICMEEAKEPVVTRCGHLYWYQPNSWECIRVWLEQNQQTLSCPVCKSGITQDTLIPLFTREEGGGNVQGPGRPRPVHTAPVRNAQYSQMGGIRDMFGFTNRARVPQGSAGVSGAGVLPTQADRGVSGNLAQADVLSKLMVILGLLIVLAVLFL